MARLWLLVTVIVTLGVTLLVGTHMKKTDSSTATSILHHRRHRRHHRHQPLDKKFVPPNFVIVLTDDLDWTLGGMQASTLQRTRHLLAEQGGAMTNWFVQTPVCCPSRAELLTGKLFHNLKVPNNNQNNNNKSNIMNGGKGCMHVDVEDNKLHPFYERDYFAQYFQQLNYTVGIFGKHLNNGNPSTFLPKGVDEMLINYGGTYLDPTFQVGTRGSLDPPRSVTFDNCTATTGMPCYSTSIIGNASLAWIKRHVRDKNTHDNNHPKPFLALISVKAPHILDGPDFPQAIPAPWYSKTTIPESLAPRTLSYNYSASDHHWLVRNQLPLTLTEGQHVDELYVSRLKTLMSVDDLVEDLVQSLEDLSVLSNTYIVFTSDNGYRLGQFRMPQGKLHAYENDIRVPMLVRGPGIPPNISSTLMGTHVDLMPTLLGLAGQQDQIPITMDGRNLASCWRRRLEDDVCVPHSSASSAVLVEYQSLGDVVRYNHTIDTYNHSFIALRLLLQAHQDDDEGILPEYWFYSYDFDSGASHEQAQPLKPPKGGLLLRDLKYVEYRDSRVDWNATNRPLEQEVFDLERDPHELHNLIDHLSPLMIQALQLKLQRMEQCQGDACRHEHSSGITEENKIAIPLGVEEQ